MQSAIRPNRRISAVQAENQLTLKQQKKLLHCFSKTNRCENITSHITVIIINPALRKSAFGSKTKKIQRFHKLFPFKEKTEPSNKKGGTETLRDSSTKLKQSVGLTESEGDPRRREGTLGAQQEVEEEEDGWESHDG